MDLDEETMLMRSNRSIWLCSRCKFYHYTLDEHTRTQQPLLSLPNVRAKCTFSSPKRPLELAQILTDRVDKVVQSRPFNLAPGLMRSMIRKQAYKSRMDDDTSIINYINSRKATNSPNRESRNKARIWLQKPSLFYYSPRNRLL